MVVNAKTLKNLKPFKPGQSGNPKGRPPTTHTLIDRIRDKLTDVCEFDAKGRTWLECLAEAELKHSLIDTGARVDLINRLCGKPQDSLALSGNLNMSWCELAKQASQNNGNNTIIEPELVDNNGK